MLVFWLLNLVIYHKRQQQQQQQHGQSSSLWLMSFASIFIPAHFPTTPLSTKSARSKFVRDQAWVFRVQSGAACIVYSLALMGCVIIVNLPYSLSQFTYNPRMVLNNIQFNVVFGSVMGMGALSVLISFVALPSSNLLFCMTAGTANGSSHQQDSSKDSR